MIIVLQDHVYPKIWFIHNSYFTIIFSFQNLFLENKFINMNLYLIRIYKNH